MPRLISRPVYGPGCEWVRLFRQANGYLGTDLLRDATDPRGYLTLDQWTTRQAWEEFRHARSDEWDAIDRRCQALTEVEEELGRFETTA